MAKTKISEYDVVAANNTDVDGINIAESCPPSGINNAIREVMAHLKDFQSGASADNLTVTGTLTSSNSLAVTGGLTLDGSAGTTGQVIVSAGSGNTPTWGNIFFAGMIMMWSGSIASIPSGWYLCDGTNSTPDLRNKFIIGANADDAGTAKTNVTGSATQTGGSKDAIVVSHTHSITDPGHSHATIYDYVSNKPGAFDANAGGTPNNWFVNGTQSATTGISINSTGSSGTNANLPPYYALAFIMKG
jgi:hypothetical protein